MMTASWVLEKQDQDKLRLCQFLTSQVADFVTIRHLLAEMGWTRYRFGQALAGLEQDLKKLWPEQPPAFALDASRRGVQVDHRVLLDVKRLTHEYRQQSIIWALLGEIFAETFVSYEVFAETHHTTVPIARAIKKQIAVVLARVGITLTRHNALIGDETTIRVFFFGLMREAYVDQEIPFPAEMRIRAEAAVTEILALYQLPERETTKQAIRMQFAIWYSRLVNHHAIMATEMPPLFVPLINWDEQHHQIHAGLVMMMRHFVDLPDAVLAREAEYAIASMYVAGFLGPIPDALLTETATRKLQPFTTTMQREFETVMHQALDSETLSQMMALLSPTHVRLLYFSHLGFRPMPDVVRAKHRFPIQTQIILTVVAKLAVALGIPEQALLNVLFEEYLTAMIQTVATKKLLPKIKVIVDMNNLPSLEALIVSRLEQTPLVNIVVSHEAVPQADFYISDIEIAGLKNATPFIWSHYPDENEFNKFIEKATDLTVHRMTATD